ncbi:hypothetical protein KBG31_01010 [Patescibacteria group bacterium]|nr:hypothetical protein [Patescibacteria group bacterium]
MKRMLVLVLALVLALVLVLEGGVSPAPLETVGTGHEGVLICAVDKPAFLALYLARYDAFVGEHGTNSFTEAVCASDCSRCTYRFYTVDENLETTHVSEWYD